MVGWAVGIACRVDGSGLGGRVAEPVGWKVGRGALNWIMDNCGGSKVGVEVAVEDTGPVPEAWVEAPGGRGGLRAALKPGRRLLAPVAGSLMKLAVLALMLGEADLERPIP